MLTVANLTKTYGLQNLLDKVSFTVGKGERVGLVGRNGSGKTTLFRMILGEEQADSGVINLSKGYRIGHLSQQIAFRGETVLKEACLDLPKDEEGTDRTYEAKAILLGLGFSDNDFYRSPLELSGGYQIRLNLARVLTSRPDLLLLDEPTNYLDILSVRWLTQFLCNWKGELILITHDRAFMDAISTHTMAIHRSKVRKIAGPTQKLYGQILKEEEVEEHTRVNEEKKRKELEQFISRFRAQATRAKAVQSKIKVLQRKGSSERHRELKNLDFEFPSLPFPGKWLLEVRDLSFSFDPGGTPLINGLSMAAGRRDRIAIIGKNGKGKTTLLNLLAGELVPSAGLVYRHENVKIAYFGQTNVDRLDPEQTVEGEILATRPDLSRGAARDICGAVMFEGDKALKKIGVLSGGEKSRVLLGKLLVTPANLLLLDEPTNHLDMESVDSLIEAVAAFGGAVLIATHSEMILRALATRLIVFDGGRVSLFEGTYDDFLERVGWENEEPVPGKPIQATEEPKRSIDRKDLRRMRAEIISSRSKTLGPLQQRISGLEGLIMDLETQVEENNQALVRASNLGDGKAIVALSISIHEARKKIEISFEELEALTGEHYVRSKEFEVRLDELDQSTAYS
jgi:ATP-binding cassette, subfamily F, member 3